MGLEYTKVTSKFATTRSGAGYVTIAGTTLMLLLLVNNLDSLLAVSLLFLQLRQYMHPHCFGPKAACSSERPSTPQYKIVCCLATAKNVNNIFF